MSSVGDMTSKTSEGHTVDEPSPIDECKVGVQHARRVVDLESVVSKLSKPIDHNMPTSCRSCASVVRKYAHTNASSQSIDNVLDATMFV